MQEFGFLLAVDSGKIPCTVIPLPLGACSQLVGALISLGGKPHALHSGWFLISVANLVVIALMITVFLLALFLRFPGEDDEK